MDGLILIIFISVAVLVGGIAIIAKISSRSNSLPHPLYESALILRQGRKGWTVIRSTPCEEDDTCSDWFAMEIHTIQPKKTEIYVLVTHLSDLQKIHCLEDRRMYSTKQSHPSHLSQLYELQVDEGSLEDIELGVCSFWAADDRDALQRFFCSHIFWGCEGGWRLYKGKVESVNLVATGIGAPLLPRKDDGSIEGAGSNYPLFTHP